LEVRAARLGTAGRTYVTTGERTAAFGNRLTPPPIQVNRGQQFPELPEQEPIRHQQIPASWAGELAHRAGIAVIDETRRIVLHAERPSAAGAHNDAAELMRPPLRLTCGPAIQRTLRLHHALPYRIRPGCWVLPLDQLARWRLDRAQSRAGH